MSRLLKAVREGPRALVPAGSVPLCLGGVPGQHATPSTTPSILTGQVSESQATAAGPLDFPGDPPRLKAMGWGMLAKGPQVSGVWVTWCQPCTSRPSFWSSLAGASHRLPGWGWAAPSQLRPAGSSSSPASPPCERLEPRSLEIPRSPSGPERQAAELDHRAAVRKEGQAGVMKCRPGQPADADADAGEEGRAERGRLLPDASRCDPTHWRRAHKWWPQLGASPSSLAVCRGAPAPVPKALRVPDW